MIAAYAISGMIAGILNKFGKIGVIVGFCVGNIVLAYVSNGYTVELIHFKEILIASIGLLAIPKTISIDIEEFVGSTKLFPVGRERSLTNTKETAEKLNNVSETIKQIANTYKEENIDNEENKQIFITELLAELEPYQENLLYEDLSDENGKILDEIFKYLFDKQEIDRENLLKIFADCNSYIVGFDDKEVSKYLEENISQVLAIINTSYKISKTNFVYKKKIKENKKNMEMQLNGVSKAISGIAKNLEKEIEENSEFEKQKIKILELLKQKEMQVDEISIKQNGRFQVEIFTKEQDSNEEIENILSKVLGEKIEFNAEGSVGSRLNFISSDKYDMAIGIAEATKTPNSESGDSILNIRLKDGKYLLAISDGMGSGKKARQSSQDALKMLESLLESGVNKNALIELITTSLINKNEEMFATLDIAIIDLYLGNIEFIKSGACPTYIKNKKKVQIIKSDSLPVGMINNENLEVFDRDIQSGEIMVMCTDGIIDANVEYKNKELWVKYLLEDIETVNTKKISDLILNEAIDNNYGKTKDDMSIVTCKFVAKK